MRIRRRGVDPTGYAAASVDAVTATSLSVHERTAPAVGLVLVVGVAEVDGLVDGLVEGDVVGDVVAGEVVADEVGDEPGEASELDGEPTVRSQTQRAPSRTATTTRRARSRRTQ
jgi:hypothetical protein